MKCVVHIITGLNVGGAERALYSLVTGGLQAHFNNHVISLMDDGHYGPLLREARIPVTSLNMRMGLPMPVALWHLRKAIRATSPDLVQGWMYHGNLAASVAKRFAGGDTRLAWNIRLSREGAGEMKATTNSVVRIGAHLSQRVDAILYNSARSRSQHEAEGFAMKRGSVIPNGFDTQKWCPDSSTAINLRQELNLPGERMLIGFVARAHIQKDLPNLFTAFEWLAAQNHNCHLICVGRGLEEAAPLNLDRSRVSFLGQRTDVPQIMPAFDLLCLSSSVEAFPNVIGEAMACGVPCITTDVGDAAAIVGETGWIVPPRNSQALAEALLQALTMPKMEQRRRSIAARRRIEENYSLSSAIGKYVSLYSSLLGHP